ncbi:MAG TPA: hypothetical protein VHD56_08195 [Tepidisphaeraceae bacterium]|nr:hypothetical protein [Tepidisphaeraceae bacterium]
MNIDKTLKPSDLSKLLSRLFGLAINKLQRLNRAWDNSRGAPVFTVDGQYTARAWTQWTHGFQFGCPLLVYEITGDKKLLDLARKKILVHMPQHVTHMGVHDHGFNNISTFGNLRRLMFEGKIPHNDWELRYYELALKASGAVQAARWAGVRVDHPSPHSAGSTQLGYIYSFNGQQSLFIDTMRTLRSLCVAWQLGQKLLHENDRQADLLKRAVLHALVTNQYLMYHGDSSQTYDVAGRTAHEAIFNRTDGVFRNRSTQQGYSPFSTWTRGLAWAMLGFAEQLEFLSQIPVTEFQKSTGLSKSKVISMFEQAARQTCDHYINDCSASDGITYWDDGAPGLARLGNWRDRPADPFNNYEPVDSSAGAIASQGLLRLGNYLGTKGKNYTQAGLTIAKTLLDEPYLSTDRQHQGLLLHTIYHRPNGWDHIPRGSKIPNSESCMWGDYHLLELAVMIWRLSKREQYPTFFSL